MFTIGDKVVYPMHGAGTIEKIEEKNILGETKKYYILKVPYGDIKIMVPVEATHHVGIRPVISEFALSEIIGILSDESSVMPTNWNRRYRANMEKLKTGQASEVAEVVRNLERMDRYKKLSTGEKKMLSNAKQILMSEIILIKNIGQAEAEAMIASVIEEQ